MQSNAKSKCKVTPKANQTNANDSSKINVKPRMQKTEISTPKPSPNQPVKLTPNCVQNQSQKWMQTNTNTKVKATPKSRSLQHQKQVQSDPKIKLKTNFKNKPTSKTHERTHEQTCCKLHKQTHEITVALMRKEMQNWPTNRIKNATKMHEETHGQHHTTTRTKLLTLGPRVSVHTEPRIGSFAKPLDRTSLIGVHSRVHQSECA